MTVYGKYADGVNGIIVEGLNITLKFERTGNNAARISWNIPMPANGCSAETQAYDGIVITISDKPANYISTSPKDGTYYNADPTADPDLFSGDKLDGARVIGAFYHNKTTVYLDITDVADKTAYYVSAYAVDNVCRYHREGVHAYSLPTGTQETNGTSDTPATLALGLDSAGITGSTETGLESGKTYYLTFMYNKKKYKLTIDGNLALTYDDLINEINRQFIILSDPYTDPSPPNAGKYYLNLTTHKLFIWDGYTNTEVEDFFFTDADPSIPLLNAYWFNPTTEELQVYTGVWTPATYKKSTFDFSDPACYNYWFNGTTVYKWEKILWCELPTYVSTTNPLLPPELGCFSFWYDTVNGGLFEWDDIVKKWNPTNAIYYNTDPTLITDDNFWYNQTDSKVYIYYNSQWNELTNVRYEEPNDEDTIDTPTANHYWFIPSQQKLYKRDATNTIWELQNIVLSISDPTVRVSCQLWWDSTPSVDALYVWDAVNSTWKLVVDFYQSAVDPSLPKTIPLNSMWYNPDTEVLTQINNLDCSVISYVYSATDPTIIALNDIWYNPDTEIWYIWNGSGWTQFDVIVSETDPYLLSVGTLWYDTLNSTLNMWNGTSWDNVEFSTTPYTPEIGFLWYDPTTFTLYEWTGATWVTTVGFIYSKLILGNHDINEMDNIVFYSKDTGCGNKLEFIFEDGDAYAFSHLNVGVVYNEPIEGSSALSPGPMYKQLGVGTDGTPDERRALHDSVIAALGDISTGVELTKLQINECIDNALMVMRKNSSYSYKRGFFFLDLKPNQQIYTLTNKCVGFNTVVNINAIYRMRAGFMRGGFGGNPDIFSMAALQQLYTLGTFDMLSYHLVSSYIKDLERMFADNIMYQWNEVTRKLRMYQTFWTKERALIDATVEKTEQDILTNRQTMPWIKQYTIAEAKLMLSQIRGKFQNLPGPNGSLSLNAQDLINQATAEKAALLEELKDPNMQDMVDMGMRSHFIIG